MGTRFLFAGNFVEFSCKLKMPSGQDRTAAEGNYVAEAPRRRACLKKAFRKQFIAVNCD